MAEQIIHGERLNSGSHGHDEGVGCIRDLVRQGEAW
jgi:hypothetical protein